MKVFVFDLLAYGENLDHIKEGTELPYPLSKRHFKSDVAVRTYAEHLAAWEELDKLGYDGVGFNEHHCSPYEPDELAQPDGFGGGAAHQEPQAPDLRQPAAAARSRCGSPRRSPCSIASSQRAA